MRNERVVTQKDIAAKLNLSQSLVAGVLGGRSNVWASEETRRRIHGAARDLGYRPNAIARSLRQRHTDIIGFHSCYGHVSLLNSWTAEVVDGMHAAAEKVGTDFLIHGNVAGRSTDDIFRELLNGKVDGLVLLSPADDPLIALLADCYLPVVLLADAAATLPSVVTNDAAGSWLLAAHLAERGHKRVLYRASPIHTVSDIRRRTAFEEAAREHGLAIVDIVETVWGKGLSAREMDWLTAPADKRPTALVCWNDSYAYWALDSCLDAGLRIPEDVAVVGFNGCPTEGRQAYPLTTIRAHWGDVAGKAVALLDARIRGEEIPMETVMPVDLVIGNTT